MLRQNSLGFEEHLFSLSFANRAVNTSLTPSRAHFPKGSIWPGCPQHRGERCPTAALGLCRCLGPSLSRCSRCSQGATANPAQMFYLWGAQELGPMFSMPLSSSLSLSWPVCASGVRRGPAADSAAQDAEVCVA